MTCGHQIPLLREIIRPITAIGPNVTVREVVEIFQGNPSLLAQPVVEEGRYLGVVSRKSLFFRHLGKPFAMDLYGRKPVQVVMEENAPVMGPDPDINEALARLLAVDAALETDSFPVVDGGECLGIVTVSDLMMKVSETQSELLRMLQSLGARIREEVEKASRIQQDLLPPPQARFGGISLSAGVTTSSEIGGDFYDYFMAGDGRLGLVIGDVSGHGVQSGMVTTAAKASLHTLISMGVTTPAGLLCGMNRAIFATARQSLLMTCLIVLIDMEEERLTYANAGHNFPYLYRNGEGSLEKLEDAVGFPLGFEMECTLAEYSMPFGRGDRLVLYTDGILECTDRRGEEFGYERLEASLLEEVKSAPEHLRRHLLAVAGEFTGSGVFEDDVTLLVASFDGVTDSDYTRGEADA